MTDKRELVIIGGGPAGLAAALGARQAGVKDILILERDERLGGILNQCIHNGFGLHTFQEELTGPEYADRFIQQVEKAGIDCQRGAMVLQITPEKQVTFISKETGLVTLQANAIVLAMGCRERPRGALNIPGFRPAGIYSAGTAQKLVNIDGFMPGHNVVILGSGDIGLIMARRMVLEGAKVAAVVELMPYSSGLKRNIVQCLDDFDIPLLLSHTVTGIRGKNRIEAVTISQVDENRRPISGTEVTCPCDTLLLSCGLIPENELSRQAGIEMSPVTGGPLVGESLQTSIPGIFAAGNVLHVHDLVDFVSQEARKAGEMAAHYIQEGQNQSEPELRITLKPEGLVRYSVPAWIDPSCMEENQTVRFRVSNVLKNGYLDVIIDGNRRIHRKKMIMTPGEMESVVLKKEWITPKTREIVITTEENEWKSVI